MHLLPIATALIACQLTVLAQRDEPTLEWQKRKTTIAYGAVKVGKHSLAELPVGGEWRLGMNYASTWSAEMPILVGDRVLPPGEYRINIQRLDNKRCIIFAQGSAMAFGGGSDGDIRIEGELGKAKKATKKLEIEWQKVKKSKDVSVLVLPATVEVQFGADQWSGAVTLLSGKTEKLGRYKLTVFALPAAAIEARDKVPVPVAVLTKGKSESWNVVLGGGEARLVPWMVAPVEENGFGSIAIPDETLIARGAVKAEPAQVEDPIAELEGRESSFADGQFTIQLAAGKEVLTLSLPEPPAAKGTTKGK